MQENTVSSADGDQMNHPSASSNVDTNITHILTNNGAIAAPININVGVS